MILWGSANPAADKHYSPRLLCLYQQLCACLRHIERPIQIDTHIALPLGWS